MYYFISDCFNFRKNDKREKEFQNIIFNASEITESEFLKDINLRGLLDSEEDWNTYKSGCQDIKYFKSLDYKYFQTSGFEFLFKRKMLVKCKLCGLEKEYKTKNKRKCSFATDNKKHIHKWRLKNDS